VVLVLTDFVGSAGFGAMLSVIALTTLPKSPFFCFSAGTLETGAGDGETATGSTVSTTA
jgi:hypothetical protein